MDKEYIEREAVIETLDWYEHEFPECETMILAFRKDISAPLLPAADVVPIAKINDAVDEALRILDAINSSGCITYNTYCELHNAICEIYQDSL